MSTVGKGSQSLYRPVVGRIMRGEVMSVFRLFPCLSSMTRPNVHFKHSLARSMHLTTPFSMRRKKVLYLQVLSVGGLNLVSPEATDDDTGDADVERDLSPEVSGLCKVCVSTCSCPSSTLFYSRPHRFSSHYDPTFPSTSPRLSEIGSSTLTSSVSPDGGPLGDELVLTGGSGGSETPSSGADSTGSESEHRLLFVV